MEKNSQASRILKYLYKKKDKTTNANELSEKLGIKLKQISPITRLMVSRGLLRKTKLKNKSYLWISPSERNWAKKILIKQGEIDNADDLD